MPIHWSRRNTRDTNLGRTRLYNLLIGWHSPFHCPNSALLFTRPYLILGEYQFGNIGQVCVLCFYSILWGFFYIGVECQFWYVIYWITFCLCYLFFTQPNSIYQFGQNVRGSIIFFLVHPILYLGRVLVWVCACICLFVCQSSDSYPIIYLCC